MYEVGEGVHGYAHEEVNLLLVHQVGDDRLFELAVLVDMLVLIDAYVGHAEAVEIVAGAAGGVDSITTRYKAFDGVQQVRPLFGSADGEEDILLGDTHTHGQH